MHKMQPRPAAILLYVYCELVVSLTLFTDAGHNLSLQSCLPVDKNQRSSFDNTTLYAYL